MARGRKPDAPGLQKAKGYPGKRKTKEQKRIEEAEHLADLMKSAPVDASAPLSPPKFLDQRFAPALAVWNDYAPRLAQLNLLDPTFRHTFAMFCIWMGEFLTANEDIQKSGYCRLVKTVSGDKMPRENPSVGRRETAMKFVMTLSERFGFTPLDQYKLLRDQGAMRPAGGLFDAAPDAEDKPPAEKHTSAIGCLDGADSDPPGYLN